MKSSNLEEINLVFEQEDDLEECVFCHKITDVRKDTPVNERKYRVDGAGELHKKCYEIVYSFKHE